ncbi:alpha/beta fold hydrolase [Microbacterium xanthum]|uniref:alpha/beta fold hydrolase n=1 Tax=Microbacterium xanthum TaxID=3079794 RepID=UPI002AD2760D|nr:MULTISPECIES: alpha/beta fold hydrolase [unclassified Microbacterium]MDZ8172334.1 alpha/beta fold hydrolase [Microbacterium sp. KSW-48]MDZ8201948.1 alpha/beta fold hydrolase [Microbacterium sp. SSW1-59]
MAETEIFEPDGRAIPYADDHAAGPTLVLVPGAGLRIGYLGLLAEALGEEDFRVVRIGTRDPDASPTPPTLHDLAGDVVDVMDHIGLTRPWVGGHGFGGTLARAVAADHPSRAAGILLLGVEGDAPVAVSPLSEIPENAYDIARLRMQATARASSPEISPHLLPAGVPVLVIQGAEDAVMPPSHGHALREAAPERVSVKTIDGAADLFPLTHVGETAWPIEDYLDWD